MNEQQLKIFLAVADSRSFTYAARALYLSQATISRNIAALEDELEITLFYRNNKSVSLSPSGEIMFEALGRMEKELEQAKKKARNAMQSTGGTLSIGFIDGQLLDETILLSLERFEKRFPNVTVDMVRGSYKFLTDSLRDGTLDIVETLLPVVENICGIDYLPVCRLDTLLIMPRFHKNADREGLTLRDFSGDTFIVPFDMKNQTPVDRLTNHCREAGFEPNIILARDVKTQLFLVETNKGLAVANENHMMAKCAGVTYTVIPEYPPEYLVIAWRRENRNKLACDFRAILSSINHVGVK